MQKEVKKKEESDEEEKTDSTPENSSLSKAGFSLVGLIAIGALVYYGMPYLQQALDSALKKNPVEELVPKGNKEAEEEPTSSGVTEETTPVPVTPVEPEPEPKVAKGLLDIDPVTQQQLVKEAMEAFMRKDVKDKGEFFLDKVTPTKTGERLLVEYYLFNEKRTMNFYYSDEFKTPMFRADYEYEDEERKFFSSRPGFTLPK